MVATGKLFHIQPSTYCPASAPFTHAMMVLIDTINLFVGFNSAVDPIELAGKSAVRLILLRTFDALGQIYTATLPFSGDILNDEDASLLDDADSVATG
jgi:hypothetical protein